MAKPKPRRKKQTVEITAAEVETLCFCLNFVLGVHGQELPYPSLGIMDVESTLKKELERIRRLRFNFAFGRGIKPLKEAKP